MPINRRGSKRTGTQATKNKAMNPLLVLFNLILLFHIHSCPEATSALSLAKPRCQDICGNLSVPYPFGMGNKNCYRDAIFEVICNNTYYNPPKLFWGNMEVVKISLQGQHRILNHVSKDCHGSPSLGINRNYPSDTFSRNPYTVSINGSWGLGTDRNYSFDSLSDNPFTISDTENKLTVLGCDTGAYIYDPLARFFSNGCIMTCNKSEVLINGSCTGIGCCQTSVPKGFKYLSIDVSSYYNHTYVYDFNPCSYAFIVDYNWYSFSVSHLLNFTDNIDESGYPRVPLVLDWAIDWPTENSRSCDEAMKNLTSYVCGKNSVCDVSKNGLGYSCNCLRGYQGNPYLQDGCQDINECTNPIKNHCSSISLCTNLPGTYKCSCPHGFQGDGWKNGTRCVPNPKKFPVLVVTIASISGSLGLSILVFGSLWLRKLLKKGRKNKLKQKFFQQNGGVLLQQQISLEKGDIEKTKIFSDEELEKATDNFNKSRILGHGAQGTVYKGMLSDGRIVAIKKSQGVHDQGRIEQFINEIAILSQINHRNVVKLYGCCLETEVPLLVYEFISNGTLFTHIHDKSGEFCLTWDDRLRIAAEVARALAYLHSAASIPIYHRDIKSTNILLDDRYGAKVSDFGISRSVSIEKTHLTTLVRGTFGYLDPEYFQSNQFTEKSDVYSFGVVLVELLTGKMPSSSTISEEEKGLVANFICSMEENRLFEIFDAQILEEGKKEELEAIAGLADRCLNMNGKKRPTMEEVATTLEGLKPSPLENVHLHEIKQDEDCFVTEPICLWDTSSMSTTSHTTLTSFAIPLDDWPLDDWPLIST